MYTAKNRSSAECKVSAFDYRVNESLLDRLRRRFY
ncbi:unnamed protein product [Rhizoctonia solani]|uniref:Uncharacterized protein n=1 Tax=Rhizoctonia solani TaxID=456999 RepID=A0A8H3DGG2_9AGAM|nr:unnamed protein product [Rhizoctonia solani]